MFSLLQVVHVDEGQPADTADRLLTLFSSTGAALPGVVAAKAGKTLPRALNGGQLMWRMSFATEQDCWRCLSSPRWQADVAPALAPQGGISVDRAAYHMDFSDVSDGRRQRGVWRCLVLAVEPRTRDMEVDQLERDLLLMPRYIPEIRNWALGRVVSAQGRRAWTHVWEQEFDDMQGLDGPYMTHPVHWGLVDGWFDPECPQRIVDPMLIHAALAIEEPVII
jgi:Stress responsive A/B Barrel Domain